MRHANREDEEICQGVGDGLANKTALLREYPEYIERLRRFSVDYDLGIFDAGHDELVNEAQDAGLVYKPCGAGGGDIGVALATTRLSLASFEKTAMRAGFTALESSIDPRGAMLHDKDEP